LQIGKKLRISQIYFPMGKMWWTGSTAGGPVNGGCTVDRGRAHGRGSLERDQSGARAHWSSQVVARDEDGDETKPRGCSPKQGQWRRGGVTTAKNGGSVSSTRGPRSARETSKARGGAAICSGGMPSLL
jgi:hypothetical protein